MAACDHSFDFFQGLIETGSQPLGHSTVVDICRLVHSLHREEKDVGLIVESVRFQKTVQTFAFRKDVLKDGEF